MIVRYFVNRAPALHLTLLYLISKCALAIGRNCITWQSVNLASALTIAFMFMDVSLIFLNSSWNHSADKSKSQIYASYAYLLSKYGIILIK